MVAFNKANIKLGLKERARKGFAFALFLSVRGWSIFFVGLVLFAQDSHSKPTGLPPYKSIAIPFDEYGEHYDMTIDAENTLFVASENGVKIFDGIKWQLVEVVPSVSIRKLFYYENKVYVGGSGVIGYIAKDNFGSYQFVDLTPANYIRKFETIWTIGLCNNRIFFRDIYDIFAFDLGNKKVQSWHFKTKTGEFVCYDSTLLLQDRSSGFIELKNNSWEKSDIELENNSLIYELTSLEDAIFILSDSNNLRLIKDRKVIPLKLNVELKNIANIVSATYLGNGKLVLGSNSGLLTFIDTHSKEVETIELTSDWIAKMIYTKYGHLLVLTEFEIFSLEWPSPTRILNSDSGISSSIHTMRYWNNDFYVLSSAGIYKEVTQPQTTHSQLFQKLNWTTKEAWSLLPINKQQALFAESHKLLLVDNKVVKTISDTIYPREIYASKFHENWYFIITEQSLLLLIYKDAQWMFSQVLNQRPVSFVEINPDAIVANFFVDLPVIVSYDSVGGKRENGQDKKIELSQLNDEYIQYFFKNNKNKTLAVSDKKFYELNEGKFSEINFKGISQILEKGEVVKFMQDSNHKYYGYSNTRIFIESDENKWQVIQMRPYLKSIIRSMVIDNGEVKISSHDKIISYNPREQRLTNSQKYKVLFRSILFSNKTNKQLVAFEDNQEFNFEQGTGSLLFTFSANTIFKVNELHYQYRLKGYDDVWSDNFTDNQISFTKLPAGTYQMELRAHDTDGNTYEGNRFQFSVYPHWYLHSYAKFTWLILAIFVLAYLFRKILQWRENKFLMQKKALKEVINQKTLALKQANDELKKLANLDGLTSLYNRRYMDKYIEDMPQKKIKKVFVMMLDMDYFKKYNDKFGHVAGDKLLCKLAQIMQQEIDFEDAIAVRYGGEEFLIIICNEDLSGVLDKAESIKSLIENKDKNTSVSIGISATTKKVKINSTQDIRHLIHLADKALYQAKKAGRNAIKIHC